MDSNTLTKFKRTNSPQTIHTLRVTEIAMRIVLGGESREVATATVDAQLSASGVTVKPSTVPSAPSPKRPTVAPNAKAPARTKKPGPQVVKPSASAPAPQGLVNASGLINNLWPDKASRPSERWARQQAAEGRIPSVRIGASVFFEVAKVRAALLGETPASKLTTAEAAKLSNAELWTMCEAIKDTAEQREFYITHLKRRPGLA